MTVRIWRIAMDAGNPVKFLDIEFGGIPFIASRTASRNAFASPSHRHKLIKFFFSIITEK